jgi:type I restriction enzyme S subunit
MEKIKIPEDWEVVETDEVFTVETGSTPSTFNREYWQNGTIDWITPADMSEMKNDISIKPSSRKVTEKAIKETNLTLMPKDSIIISTRAPVGYVGIVENETAFNQGCKGLIPKDRDKVHSAFFCYYFLGKRKILENQSSGSTFKELSKDRLASFKLPLPPLPEQRAIARVLSTVDDAIQKTDEAIEKTERLKRGVMKRLLTEGIGNKEFKETEIGRIPREWEVERLGDVVEIRGNKSLNNLEKVAFVPMELVPNYDIFTKYQIRSKKDVKSFTYCEAGDLLLAKITPSLENGKQGIVPFDIPNKIALATTEVFPMNCKEIDRFFLFYILKFSKFRNRIISSMIGTTGRQRASKESVENLKIPLPSVPEQQKIASILSTIDKKIEIEGKRKEKLERIKKGLMNDLLTGRKRVRV